MSGALKPKTLPVEDAEPVEGVVVEIEPNVEVNVSWAEVALSAEANEMPEKFMAKIENNTETIFVVCMV